MEGIDLTYIFTDFNFAFYKLYKAVIECFRISFLSLYRLN